MEISFIKGEKFRRISFAYLGYAKVKHKRIHLCRIKMRLLEIIRLEIISKRRFFNLINKVEIASVDTAKLPVLSNEEKQELLIKIKNGDEIAREKFINGNLRLVLSVVQRFGGRGEQADDLFQIGCVRINKSN